MHEISTFLDNDKSANPLTSRATILPFGSHEGRSVEELLVEQPTYLWWLLSQIWVWLEYPELCQSIRNLGPRLLTATPKIKPWGEDTPSPSLPCSP
jgi:hypothetical protein